MCVPTSHPLVGHAGAIKRAQTPTIGATSLPALLLACKAITLDQMCLPKGDRVLFMAAPWTVSEIAGPLLSPGSGCRRGKEEGETSTACAVACAISGGLWHGRLAKARPELRLVRNVFKRDFGVLRK